MKLIMIQKSHHNSLFKSKFKMEKEWAYFDFQREYWHKLYFSRGQFLTDFPCSVHCGYVEEGVCVCICACICVYVC